MEDLPITALAADLRAILGPDGVSADPAKLEKASADGSYLSPIIREQLPLGQADLVAFPSTAAEIAETVATAVRHHVPITPRGKGTGNYGQAIPMAGGLVVDTSRARAIVEVAGGSITAEAGTTMVSLEQAANEVGRQILMYPSTVQSSIGGFLAGGSGGTGSIRHGMLHTGFVLALDVVHATGDGELIHVEGAEAEQYLHNYGTAGIIARATVRLEPLQDWRGFFASFDSLAQVASLIPPFAALAPTPRLVSADPALLANALPSDPGIPADRASLRAILDASTVDEATALVLAAGGRVDDIRQGTQTSLKLSRMSYNHPIEWLQRTHPGRYFHVEVAGNALVERTDDVITTYPGGSLHLEAQQRSPIGMLVGEYESADRVYAGFERLRQLGVGFHNPHQWYVDYRPDETRLLAGTTDPDGLLNPGKLVKPVVATGRQR
jgi:FAD/FMN-containing dehydrogenase